MLLFMCILISFASCFASDNLFDKVENADWDEGFANSVYIEIYDSTDFTADGNYVTYSYELLKPLTLTGVKDLGNMSFAYDSLFFDIEIRKARMITDEGEIIELDSTNIKDEVMSAFAGLVYWSNLRNKIITFPSLDIDYGVEIEVVYRTKKPRFEGLFELRDGFQTDEPILHIRKVLTTGGGTSTSEDIKLNTAVVNDNNGWIKSAKEVRLNVISDLKAEDMTIFMQFRLTPVIYAYM